MYQEAIYQICFTFLNGQLREETNTLKTLIESLKVQLQEQRLSQVIQLGIN